MSFAGLVVFALLGPLAPNEQLRTAVTLAGGLIMAVGVLWERRTSGPLDLPMVCFLLITAVSTALSRDLIGLFPSFDRGDGFLVFLAYGLAALVASRVYWQEGMWLRGLFWIAIFEALLAIAQVAGLDLSRISHLPPEPGSAYGTFGNRLFLGAFLVMLLPTAAEVAPWWGALLFLSIGLTLSRTAFIAACAFLVYRMFWGCSGEHKCSFQKAALSVMLYALAGALMVLSWTLPNGAHVTDLSSGTGRLVTWAHVLPLIAQRPFFGWGLNTLVLHLGRNGFVDNPHSEPLYIAYSFGLFGLAAYLWVWYRALAPSLSGTHREGRLTVHQWGPLATGLILGGLCLLTSWSHIGLANVLWTMLGLCVAQREHG